jgi:subtilase family serine protease
MRPSHRSRSSRARSLALESLETRALLSHGGMAVTAFVKVDVATSPAPTLQAGASHHHHGLPAPHQGKTPVAHAPAPAPVSFLARPMSRPQSGGGGSAVSAPYTPAQVRHAYGVDTLSQDGSGQTIAIVDAYDDPTIGNDLHAFDQQFHLPDPVLSKAMPMAGTPAYDSGWAGEIALDVEWAHAMAPKAKILLVEAPSASYADLLSAVDYAVSQGAKQVSMSWSGSEFSGVSSYDTHFKVSGVSFTAASGDSGAGVGYPAASPYVTAVGGTSLAINSSGNRLSETAWSGSGGGFSSFLSRPSYQNGFERSRGRGVPDVSFNADPNTGFYVYDSSSGGAWWQVGGTSAGAPQWAGLFALVNQGRAAAHKAALGSGLTYGTNQVLYKLAGGSAYSSTGGDFLDITRGSNGYPATTGWDPVTGLGSPNAGKLVPDLINA